MKKQLKKIIATTLVAAVVVVGVVAFTSGSVAALDPGDAIKGGSNAAGGSGARPLGDSIKIVVNILLFVLGAIAVIMIIIGGIRYTTSNGDSSQIQSAKNTVLYSVIGLIVALLAYAIVNFVLDQFVVTR